MGTELATKSDTATPVADDMSDELEALEELAERQAARPARLSRHARRRAARRNLVPDAVDYVMTYGRCLYRTGALFYFLARRDLPPADRGASWAARLEGTVVLVARDGDVITVYRNRRALSAIRRKMKRQLSWRAAQDTEAMAPDVAEMVERRTA